MRLVSLEVPGVKFLAVMMGWLQQSWGWCREQLPAPVGVEVVETKRSPIAVLFLDRVGTFVEESSKEADIRRFPCLRSFTILHVLPPKAVPALVHLSLATDFELYDRKSFGTY